MLDIQEYLKTLAGKINDKMENHITPKEMSNKLMSEYGLHVSDRQISKIIDKEISYIPNADGTVFSPKLSHIAAICDILGLSTAIGDDNVNGAPLVNETPPLETSDIFISDTNNAAFKKYITDMNPRAETLNPITPQSDGELDPQRLKRFDFFTLGTYAEEPEELVQGTITFSSDKGGLCKAVLNIKKMRDNNNNRKEFNKTLQGGFIGQLIEGCVIALCIIVTK